MAEGVGLTQSPRVSSSGGGGTVSSHTLEQAATASAGSWQIVKPPSSGPSVGELTPLARMVGLGLQSASSYSEISSGRGSDDEEDPGDALLDAVGKDSLESAFLAQKLDEALLKAPEIGIGCVVPPIRHACSTGSLSPVSIGSQRATPVFRRAGSSGTQSPVSIGSQRPPAVTLGKPKRTWSHCPKTMSLEVFLEEDMPPFPFPAVSRCGPLVTPVGVR